MGVSRQEEEKVAASIEAMTLATQKIDRKLGDALGDTCPNGLIAEIKDIKTRLQHIEGRVQFLWDHQVIVRK
jgi:hypothetical protein